jgi:hypothetical protein
MHTLFLNCHDQFLKIDIDLQRIKQPCRRQVLLLYQGPGIILNSDLRFSDRKIEINVLLDG